jgi:hypothetical protein
MSTEDARCVLCLVSMSFSHSLVVNSSIFLILNLLKYTFHICSVEHNQDIDRGNGWTISISVGGSSDLPTNIVDVLKNLLEKADVRKDLKNIVFTVTASRDDNNAR